MKLLSEGKEEDEYLEFMDKIAILIYRESVKGIAELDMKPNTAHKSHEELGWAVGQVVHDEVLKLTEGMDVDQLKRWFTETAFNLLVAGMKNHPEFLTRVIMLSAMK